MPNVAFAILDTIVQTMGHYSVHKEIFKRTDIEGFQSVDVKVVFDKFIHRSNDGILVLVSGYAYRLLVRINVYTQY